MTGKICPGFTKPKQNWSKLPHLLFQYMDKMTGAELKIVLYVLRHTWGFSEFTQYKRITLNEFQYGRKYRNGERMDVGTGLSVNAIKDGIARAIEHGFLIQLPDNRDAARHSHEYQLNMIESLSENDTPPSESDAQPSQTNSRSEKEALETKEEKEDFLSNTPISGRERIRDILVDVLADGVMPESDFLLRPFEHGVDALVTEFRKLEGKARLDADLTSKIIAAIRSAYRDEGNWQFNNTTSPTRAVIACIVAQRAKDRDMPDALANIPLFKAQE